MNPKTIWFIMFVGVSGVLTETALFPTEPRCGAKKEQNCHMFVYGGIVQNEEMWFLRYYYNTNLFFNYVCPQGPPRNAVFIPVDVFNGGIDSIRYVKNFNARISIGDWREVAFSPINVPRTMGAMLVFSPDYWQLRGYVDIPGERLFQTIISHIPDELVRGGMENGSVAIDFFPVNYDSERDVFHGNEKGAIRISAEEICMKIIFKEHEKWILAQEKNIEDNQDFQLEGTGDTVDEPAGRQDDRIHDR